MAESKEIRSQRLAAIEKFAADVDVTKDLWRGAKEKLAQARKEYEKNMDALCGMIRDRLDAPLFDTEDDSEEAA